ncbi:hypothetical protein CFS9_22470 [Flavobacterium sp. CFS9]|uniref:DUF4907 domain-containing protein n=1 Tax=Flavobacterium sp. CFS9 TaxID=3143118 RepID=A0AAT9H2B4_9FLAO
MTTKIKKPFFRTNTRKTILLIVLTLQFLACAKNETFTIEAFKTTSGWGYSIALKNKIIIKQAIIPVINDSKSFSTKNDALKVAQLVVTRLNQNRSPTITKNDLILLKIKL